MGGPVKAQGLLHCELQCADAHRPDESLDRTTVGEARTDAGHGHEGVGSISPAVAEDAHADVLRLAGRRSVFQVGAVVDVEVRAARIDLPYLAAGLDQQPDVVETDRTDAGSQPVEVTTAEQMLPARGESESADNSG